MRLLVTNPWNGQAYCVLRALRPHAAHVVVTRYQEHGALGRLAPTAVSRFADRVCPVPLATAGWQRGQAGDENSAVEERYVTAILDICERESIDTVYPSWDPEVGLLSRNQARFAARGIALPVPDWRVLRTTMDKHALAQAALAAGFPCPRTYLPRTVAEAAELAEGLGFPLFVKPRFSSGSRGARLVTRRRDLADRIMEVQRDFGMPVLQEWIPGAMDRRVNVGVTLDRTGRVVTQSARRNIRTVFRSFVSVTSAGVSYDGAPVVEDAIRLLRTLRYVGYASLQLKMDPRDGRGKLLEVNCRPGFQLWSDVATGLNIPLLCVGIARDEPVDAVPARDRGAVFLSPVEDALALLVTIASAAGRRIVPGRPNALLEAPPALLHVLRQYRDTYRAPRKVFDWYFRALADDPLAALGWYASQMVRIARLPKGVPR
jgi:predicted ATP-grasp superfamily ATP-dependent carboligase